MLSAPCLVIMMLALGILIGWIGAISSWQTVHALRLALQSISKHASTILSYRKILLTIACDSLV